MTTNSPATTLGDTLRIDLAAAGIVLSITVVAYIAVIGPLVDARTTSQIEQRELEAKQQRLAEHTSTLKALAQDLASMKEAATSLPAIQSLAEQQANHRLAELTTLAAQMNLKVNELRTAAPQNIERFHIVPIHLSGSGPFQQCTSFLHQLRTTFPDTAVWSLKISREAGVRPDHATFRADLAWFSLPSSPTNMATATPHNE